MKIAEAVALTRPALAPRWVRAKQYLDALPNDELKLTVELANAINVSPGGLLESGLPQPMTDYSDFITTGHGGKKRVFGNPKAIRELRKQLQCL